MKIQFDGHQDYQQDAIQSVVDVFTGQPLAQGEYEIRFEANGSELLSELGVGNRLMLAEEALLANVQAIQARNNLIPSLLLEGHNFSVEMETGTGKTYVYLRTLYELNARYGFTKFVIVVPSVAIREGVWSNLQLTKEHFAGLYDNKPVEAHVYNSGQVSRLRQFATSNQMQILVINIDAFNKDSAVIRKDNDKLSGRKPLEFLQAANPIVILDEPQNMETATAREAIASLNPLCTLRYSATHRNLYNLLYRLDPVQAYDLGLVKKIEVDSVLEDADFNKPYLKVLSVTPSKSAITAKIEIDVQGKTGPSRKVVTLNKPGIDLYEISGRRENYRGYIVDDITARPNELGLISLTNGVEVAEGETHGGRTDEMMRVQIKQTIREHFEKELVFSRLPEGQRLKVLSLFFIDRVANYDPADGKFRLWFEELYQEFTRMPRYAAWNPPPVAQVHDGYFAKDKEGRKDSTEGRATKADDEAYQLIMRDKERLLSRDEPLRFIFSHSALREGWDNPNVFQICTLNESKSEMRKRQEIGRGLRLPVRENGERSFDTNINILTVIANESYESFARQLQTELEQESGVKFEGRIKNKRERRKAQLRKGWQLDPNFLLLWQKIKARTRYQVHYSTLSLIERAVEELQKLPPVSSPKFRITKNAVKLEKSEVMGTVTSVREEQGKDYRQEVTIPDLLTYLQSETELTRSALAEILIHSGRLDEVAANPQQFLSQAVAAIRQTQQTLMVNGIQYEKIGGQEYEMQLFEDEELNGYLSRLIDVEHSIYDVIEYDSEIERQFAEELDQRDEVKLFIKLPPWFKIETPLGTYNPDWVIVQEDDRKVGLVKVRETKGTTDYYKIPETQRQKIDCGRKHFQALSVDYDWTQSSASV
jgi:type III restriction enzyme